MTGSVLLVRHTEVALAWRGRCYGVSDAPLSRSGWAALGPLSIELATVHPGWVVHSGLKRTRLLAERVAARANCPLHEDIDWRERDFGTWEGKTWNAIHRTTGNAMDGMILAPGEFRPGGGETTSELAERATRAWRRLPANTGPANMGRAKIGPGNIGIVITHGGPIAALLGQQRSAPVATWPALVPALGGVVHATR